jgi:hypothetical protein
VTKIRVSIGRPEMGADDAGGLIWAHPLYGVVGLAAAGCRILTVQ